MKTLLALILLVNLLQLLAFLFDKLWWLFV